jgi:putative heme-binding domain-containing protein
MRKSLLGSRDSCKPGQFAEVVLITTQDNTIGSHVAAEFYAHYYPDDESEKLAMKFQWIAVGALVLVSGLTCSGQPTPTQTDLRRYADFAMHHEGSVEGGLRLFTNELKTACAKCHSVNGSSSKAGPDLAVIGDKYPRRELIRAILEPSASIAVGYGATSIETLSGDEITGIIKQASDAAIELMGADGKLIRVPTDAIRSQRGSTVSLMPEGLQAGLSVQEFTDLVEYLVSLKQPESALAYYRGMPSDIPALAKPVEVRPFLDEALQFPHSVVRKPGDVRTGLTWFGQIPGLTNTFIVAHQTGMMWLLEKNGSRDTETVFADLSGEIFSERGPNGLLSIAFHPRFRENHKYYLNHQVLKAGKIVCRVVEREASADFRTDSSQTSRLLREVGTTTQDHTGGGIQFGPDGFLYIGMGDTGPQTDPQGHGQNMTVQLGKMLRIDVDHQDTGRAYAIPTDNPFRDRTDVCPEIWASGFREPWRFSFDSLTGDLWVGDVGQDRIEEVDIVRRGENYGWNVYEGFEPFSNHYRKDHVVYAPPVFAYGRKYGFSVTGGFVYRGDKRSSFYGVYIFGDYVSKRIWGLKQRNGALERIRQIGTCPQGIASFGTDELGNVYVVGYEGMIYTLEFGGTIFE